MEEELRKESPGSDRHDPDSPRQREEAPDQPREGTATTEPRGVVAVVGQVIDYAFYLLYTIVGLRLLLEVLGTGEEAEFKRLVDTLSGPFVSPFRGLTFDPWVQPYQDVMPFLVALLVWMLVHGALKGLLRLLSSRVT